MKRITVTSTLISLLTICFFIIILSAEDCDVCFSAPVMMLKFFTCGMVLLIGSIYFKTKFLRFERIMFDIESLPLLETNEATAEVPFSCEGEVRIKGGKILKSPYTNTDCVYFHSIKEQLVRSGKHRSWKIVENIISYVPFYLEDERGKITVDVRNIDSDFSGYKIVNTLTSVPDPDNSEIDCTPVIRHSNRRENSPTFSFIPKSNNFRYSEFVLMPSTRIFVHGYVSKRNNELVLHEYPRHPLIISKKSKDAYIEEFYKGKNLLYAVHVLAALGFTVSVLSVHSYFQLNIPFLFVILYLGNGVIFGSILCTMYNRMVTLKQRGLTSLSNIDIELKRRADLIPQLINVVKDFSRYEKEVQTAIAHLRLHTRFHKTLPEGPVPDNTTASLFAVLENYPKLKASELYRKLAIQLVDTEERIAYSRAFYNRNVRKYNTITGQFPFNIISYFFDMKRMDFLTLTSV